MGDVAAIPSLPGEAPPRCGNPPPRLAPGWAAASTPLLVLFGVLAAGGALVLFFFDPRQYHFYPFCFFHQTTGLLCPGCGALRATHQLLHGHVATAFQFNPMLVVLLPLVGWLGARWIVLRLANKPAPLRSRWLWLILAAVLVVSLLRNLPGPAFAVLRP
jgi:hypothetical protein